MTIREELDREFRFHLAGDPLAQQIAFWQEGDPAIELTPERELRALKSYVVATRKTLLHLAEILDRLEIGPGQTEE